jgi:hypothetical protein
MRTSQRIEAASQGMMTPWNLLNSRKDGTRVIAIVTPIPQTMSQMKTLYFWRQHSRTYGIGLKQGLQSSIREILLQSVLPLAKRKSTVKDLRWRPKV